MTDIMFWNNARFKLTRDVSAWAPSYDLDTADWVLQIRRAADSATIILGVDGVYADGIVVYEKSLSSVERIPAGAYVFDYGFIPSAGEFVRCSGGKAYCEQGVTRT
jgi:hypothetical protein